MSFRLLTHRLAKHGRYFIQSYCKRDICTNILEQTNKRRIPATVVGAGTRNVESALNSQRLSIFRFGAHARKLFVTNVLNRVTPLFSEELRSQASRKLFYGDSGPFFALVGVSLASGVGVLTKDDELEGVCFEIREATKRLQYSWRKDEMPESIDENFNIDRLDVGPPIAKGCAAVVYAASFKNQRTPTPTSDETTMPSGAALPKVERQRYREPLNNISTNLEAMSPIQNMSRFVHNFGGSVDNLYSYVQSAALEEFTKDGKEKLFKGQKHSKSPFDPSRFAGISSGIHDLQPVENVNASINRYPLAMKMMFNYDIQSNAMSILRAMYKETIPARHQPFNELLEDWEKVIHNQTSAIPPHPNIVLMFGYFCGEVRNFKDGHILYPIAQPPRINPDGYGRNMSLYLLMKRYDFTLRNFLDTSDLNIRTKILLLAQLLEAVTHINRHGVAHRDLKSDNILIEKNDDDSPPVLVISDFGCCIADKQHGLQIPYSSSDIDKGGNAALMAPEIIKKRPGPFSVLNYAKSDLWACGAIAYEIFGMRNPFYAKRMISTAANDSDVSLRNIDYKEEDLPELPQDCPYIVRELIYNILNPNPARRLSPDLAANVLQLYLWAPSHWLKSGEKPSSQKILEWLLSLTTKCICEGGSNRISFRNGRRTHVEYSLICSFLSRARLHRIRGALGWIHNVL